MTPELGGEKGRQQRRLDTLKLAARVMSSATRSPKSGSPISRSGKTGHFGTESAKSGSSISRSAKTGRFVSKSVAKRATTEGRQKAKPGATAVPRRGRISNQQKGADLAKAAPNVDEYPSPEEITAEVDAEILRLPSFDDEEVAASAGASAGFDSPEEMRASGEVVALPHNGRYVYPEFQFGKYLGDGIRPTVRKVNLVLMAGEDPWGAASWWTSPSLILGSRTPAQLLGTEQEPMILSAAQDGV